MLPLVAAWVVVTTGVGGAASQPGLLGVRAAVGVATPSVLPPVVTTPGSAWGGGFANVVAWSPDGSVAAVGGDTSGVHISGGTPAGVVWKTVNDGLNLSTTDRRYDPHIAALEFLSNTSLLALAGNGQPGMGRLLQATLVGSTWSWTHLLPSAPFTFTVDGTNGGTPGYGVAGRPTGRLIDIGISGRAYALTQNGLLRQSTVGGTGWTNRPYTWAGSLGTAIGSGLAVDPNNAEWAWLSVRDNPVASSGAGLYLDQSIDSSGSAPTCRVARPSTVNAKDSAQEVIVLARPGGTTSRVVVAWGASGVWDLTVPTGTDPCGSGFTPNWHELTPSSTSCQPDTTSPATWGAGWTGVDGYWPTGADATVWLGCAVVTPSAPVDGLWRVAVNANGSPGAVVPIGGTGHGTVSNVVTGTTSRTWWHTDPVVTDPQVSSPQAGLGGGQFVTAQIAINPGSGLQDQVMVAGKAGVWRTDNATATTGATAVTWQPAVQGIGSTIETRVAVNPDTPSYVAAGDVDWSLLYSRNGFTNDEPRNEDPSTSGTAPPLNDYTSWAVAADARAPVPTSNKGLWAAGALGFTGTNPNPGASASWAAIQPTPNIGGNPIVGLAIGRDDSTTPQEIDLAAISNPTVAGQSGLFIKGATHTTYDVVSLGGVKLGTGLGSDPNRIDIVWEPGTPYVFLYDNGTGLWRSSDSGSTWTKILSDPKYRSDVLKTGWIAVDPNSASGTVYLSIQHTTAPPASGVWQLNNANICSGPTTCTTSPMTATGLTYPGAVAVDAFGRTWVVQQSYAGAGNTAIYEAASGGSTTLTNVTDAAFQGGPQVVNSLAAAPGASCGFTGPTKATCVYAATQGNGLFVIDGQ